MTDADHQGGVPAHPTRSIRDPHHDVLPPGSRQTVRSTNMNPLWADPAIARAAVTRIRLGGLGAAYQGTDVSRNSSMIGIPRYAGTLPDLAYSGRAFGSRAAR